MIPRSSSSNNNLVWAQSLKQYITPYYVRDMNEQNAAKVPRKYPNVRRKEKNNFLLRKELCLQSFHYVLFFPAFSMKNAEDRLLTGYE